VSRHAQLAAGHGVEITRLQPDSSEDWVATCFDCDWRTGPLDIASALEALTEHRLATRRPPRGPETS
jgi:hypothetical protein